jgi:ribonuclease BN (tRNA processing enzyme)
MLIKFLGSGSAFCFDNYQSNILIQNHNRYLLVDCGTDIRFSLKAAAVKPTDIEAVYISHLHSDHCGGLEYLAFVTYFTPGSMKPKLYGETSVLNDLWEHTLKGGLESLQTIDADLETYFQKFPIPQKKSFSFAEVEYKLVQTVHIVADRLFKKSFGLLFKTPKGKTVFITTDTQFAPHQIRDFIKQSDIVFHDCEVSKYPSGIHANYNDLKTLPDDEKKKIWLYHYNSVNDLPFAPDDGFQGFVQKGQEFDL